MTDIQTLIRRYESMQRSVDEIVFEILAACGATDDEMDAMDDVEEFRAELDRSPAGDVDKNIRRELDRWRAMTAKLKAAAEKMAAKIPPPQTIQGEVQP